MANTAPQSTTTKPANGNQAPPANGAPPQDPKVALTRLGALQADFEKYKGTLKELLPTHIKVERVIKIAIKLYFEKPELAECTTKSMVRATLQCAELGLDPSPLLGEAAFIAFENTKRERDGGAMVVRKVKEVQLMPMYRGLTKLARNSGEVADVYAVVVDESEKTPVFDRNGRFISGFFVEQGTNRRIHHNMQLEGRKNVLFAVYGVVKYKDDTDHFEVLLKDDVERFRQFSKTKDKGPWVDNYNAMACKTAIKQALKMAPMSPEKPAFAKAVALDNAAEAGKSAAVYDEDAIDAEGEDVTEGAPETPTPAQVAAQPAAARSRASELDAKLGDIGGDPLKYDRQTGEVQ